MASFQLKVREVEAVLYTGKNQEEIDKFVGQYGAKPDVRNPDDTAGKGPFKMTWNDSRMKIPPNSYIVYEGTRMYSVEKPVFEGDFELI